MAETKTDQITVQCKCGKRLKAPATAVGKRAKCPGCGSVLTIEAPPPPPEDDLGALYDLADQEQERAKQQESAAPAGMRCPSCSSPLAPGAVICVQCGFDLRSKSKVKPKVETAAAGSSRPGLAPLGGSRPQKEDERPAAAGNYLLGLAFGFGLALVGAFICFFAWSKAPDFPFIKWMVLIIGALAGVGVNLGYKAGTHFAGATAAGITIIVGLATHFAVLAAWFAPAVSQAVDETSIDRDERVLEMLANEEDKKANVDPQHASLEQMMKARQAATKRLKAMPEKEYREYVAKADANEEKEELMEYVAEDVLKERGIKSDDASTAQEEAAQEEASKRIDAMSPAQRKEKLAAAEKDSEAQIAAHAKARAEASSSKKTPSHSSDDDESPSSGGGGGIFIFVIIMAIVFFLWAMMPTFVAMALAWKIAANS